MRQQLTQVFQDTGQRSLSADDLIEAITRKLTANRPVLERSLHFGRLSWRVQKNGDLQVDLEPKL